MSRTTRSAIKLVLLAPLFSMVRIALSPAKHVYAQLADAPWPMFHHALQHTRRSPYVGPQLPEEKWSFITGGNVTFSPAIDKDGTICVGSKGNNLVKVGFCSVI
jgi:hypothetical protein